MDQQLAKRFPVLFTSANKAMTGLGMNPRTAWVEVTPGELRVQMGWAFRMSAPRVAVRSATLDDDRVLAWGVHGWGGRWLVNGSSQGLVRVELAPPVRAWVLGFPVRLHTLRVSVTDREALVAALAVAEGVAGA